MSSNKNLEIHAMNFDGAEIQVRDIEHKNHYDYTKKHRHNYFELMLFEQGGGENLIDFENHVVKSHSCFIIFPKQIHLLNRAPGSFGDVIQFSSSALVSERLNVLVNEHFWFSRSALLFEEDLTKFTEVKTLIDLIRKNQHGIYSGEAKLSLLQSILFTLLRQVIDDKIPAKKSSVFLDFLSLLDKEIKNHHKVSFYAEQLHVSEKQLASLCKTYLGVTTLNIIHDKLVTEIKRQLLYAALSHKAIAYDLGFDSPSSFNAFVKRRTGQTPGEIQEQLSKLGV